MRNAIIVNDTNNQSLLYFTQTKVFYGAHEAIHLFKDCVTVESYSQAKQIAKGNDIVLETGDVLTPEFIDRHTDSSEVV